jgi:hypothetical protein
MVQTEGCVSGFNQELLKYFFLAGHSICGHTIDTAGNKVSKRADEGSAKSHFYVLARIKGIFPAKVAEKGGFFTVF